MSDWPDRLNRFTEALRAGRKPDRRLGRSREEIEDLRTAAELAGARSGADEPDPAFLFRLREQVTSAASPRGGRLRRAALLRSIGLWAAGFASGVAVDLGLHTVREPIRPSFAPAAATAAPVNAAPTTEIQPAVLPSGRWIPVGPLDQFKEGIAQPVEAGAIPAFILRQGGQVRGLSRVCTHMGCLLNFDPDEHELVCPCHGAWFDLNGKPDSSYHLRLTPLPPVMVQVVSETVYVLGA